MTRLRTYVLLLPVCLGLNLCAWANWGAFISTGTSTAVGAPSCAEVSTSHVVCAIRSGKSAMMVNEFSGTKWGKWTALAGTVSTDPSCSGDGNGNVICAATATTGQLEWAKFNGTTWTTPALLAATLFSAPSCANDGTGKVLCVARNATGGLAYTIYNGTVWTKVANLPAVVAISRPSCTTDNNGGVICAVFSSKGVTEVTRYNGSWQTFLNIGGIAGGSPDCTSMNQNGNVVCFAMAYSSGIFGARFNGGAWSIGDWTSYSGLSGTVTSNAGCTTQSPNELVCGATAVTDNMLYANVWNGSAWSGWKPIGGSGTGSPACAPLGTGQVVCVMMTLKNQVTSVVGP